MTLYEEIQKIDFDIKTLISKKNELQKQLDKEIKEKEENKLISNWNKYLTIYKNKKPELYYKIIMTCIPIRTRVCCGQGGGYTKIRLCDILKLWSNGYMYNECPIWNITTTNSGYKSMTYIKDGKKITINDNDIIEHYQDIPYRILGNDYSVD